MKWRKAMWRSELQEAMRLVLARGDLTATEIRDELRRVFKVVVPYPALNSILRETRGIYVKCLVPSKLSSRMVILYTLGVFMELNK